MVIICTTSFWEEENILFRYLYILMLLKFCGKKKKKSNSSTLLNVCRISQRELKEESSKMLKDQKETMDDRNVNEKNQRNIAIRRSGKELRVQREGLTRLNGVSLAKQRGEQ